MTTRKLLSVRIDKPSAKDRIIERLEAIAEQRGTSMTSLALQAIREFVEREEGKAPSQEELTRLLSSTTSLLGTVTDSLSAMRSRQDQADERLVYLIDVVWRIAQGQGVLSQEIDRNLYKALPESQAAQQLAKELGTDRQEES